MPSIAEMGQPVGCKKRRRGDEDDSRLSSPRHTHHTHAILENNSYISPRKIIAPKTLRPHDQKRQRIEIELANTMETPTLHVQAAVLAQSGQENTQSHHTSGEGKGEGLAKPKIDLSPCHICRRPPTEKSQLDSYAYCEGCGKRTCWICVRQCEGLGVLDDEPGVERFSFEDASGKEWGRERDRMKGFEEEGGLWGDGMEGHRKRICSRCCVEKGSDGEVWCMGCLRMEERGGML